MKTDYQNTIINRIRNLRVDLGYSQLDVAAILDISTGQIGNIETPKRPHKYTLSQLSRLCDEFKVPIENIFIVSQEELSKEEVIRRLINSIIEYEK